MYEPSTYLVVYLFSYLSPYFLPNWLPRWKPCINSFEVHPQLSNDRHPVDGWCAVACWFIVAPLSCVNKYSLWKFAIQKCFPKLFMTWIYVVAFFFFFFSFFFGFWALWRSFLAKLFCVLDLCCVCFSAF
jgi:hypothetical protein